MFKVGEVITNRNNQVIAIVKVGKVHYTVVNRNLDVTKVQKKIIDSQCYWAGTNALTRGTRVSIDNNLYMLIKEDAFNYVLANSIGVLFSVNKGYFNINPSPNKVGLSKFLSIVDRGEISVSYVDKIARLCKERLCSEFEKSRATLSDLRVVVECILRGSYTSAFKTNLYANLSVEYCRSLEIIKTLVDKFPNS